MTTLRNHWFVVVLRSLLIKALVVFVMAFAIATGDIYGPVFPKTLRLFSICAVIATIDQLLEWRNARIRWRVLAFAIGTVVFVQLVLQRWQ